MRRILNRNGYEVWVHFDRTAMVYELFAEKEAECYLGCADDIAEATRIGNSWINQRREES
jgi:hypothetical protein